MGRIRVGEKIEPVQERLSSIVLDESIRRRPDGGNGRREGESAQAEKGRRRHLEVIPTTMGAQSEPAACWMVTNAIQIQIASQNKDRI
jgi:hypothetical protein